MSLNIPPRHYSARTATFEYSNWVGLAMQMQGTASLHSPKMYTISYKNPYKIVEGSHNSKESFASTANLPAAKIGNSTIKGYTKKSSTLYPYCKVFVYLKSTGELLASTASNAGSFFEVTGVAEDLGVFVVAQDPDKSMTAVIKDFIITVEDNE